MSGKPGGSLPHSALVDALSAQQVPILTTEQVSILTTAWRRWRSCRTGLGRLRGQAHGRQDFPDGVVVLDQLHTTFSAELDAYLARCRAATSLPLALGFGVQDAADVAFLRGKVDIAVVGSATLRLVDDKGVAAIGAFVRGLRP